MLIKICDFLASVLITLGIFNATKGKKWWAVYVAGGVFFIYVQAEKGLIFLTLMGIITTIGGIRNYFDCRRKEDEDSKRA